MFFFFFNIGIIIPAVFWFLYACMVYLFHLFAFNLFVPLNLKSVSYWQPTGGSFCKISSDYLYLLIGLPNAFYFILFYFYTLQSCIRFAKYQNESATGMHVFPIFNIIIDMIELHLLFCFLFPYIFFVPVLFLFC